MISTINILIAAAGMQRPGYTSEHDAKVAHKLAYVMWRNLSEQSLVSEHYL